MENALRLSPHRLQSQILIHREQNPRQTRWQASSDMSGIFLFSLFISYVIAAALAEIVAGRSLSPRIRNVKVLCPKTVQNYEYQRACTVAGSCQAFCDGYRNA